MKYIFTFLVSLIMASAYSQITLPSSGGNKKASVTEWIGITQVKIDYDRPAVKGREGNIWGKVVHYGFADLEYGTSKAAPWRAGANENTTIEFSTEVRVEGKTLAAAKYGFFIAMGEKEAILIFSKYNTAWGSFYYKPEDDALRVKVPILKNGISVERLKYEFENQTDTSATVSLYWEKVMIPFTISVDLQKEQIASFRKEINNGNFYRYWQNMNTAAHYCLVNNINLEEGFTWAERAIHTFFGEANFLTLSTYAGYLEKFNRKPEADSVMKIALPMASLLQLNTYGHSLLKMKKEKEAFEVFKMNYDKNPDDIYTCLGMIRGYFFLGNKKEAISYAEKGKAISKDDITKAYFETMIADIKTGKEITR